MEKWIQETKVILAQALAFLHNPTLFERYLQNVRGRIESLLVKQQEDYPVTVWKTPTWCLQNPKKGFDELCLAIESISKEQETPNKEVLESLYRLF